MTIISGGQTGVDRAALRFALTRGMKHGGWCPRGRVAEDGVIPECYHLRETNSGDPAERTERNVIDSDATVIVTRERKLFGGTLLTRTCTQKHNKPLLIVCEEDGIDKSTLALRDFVRHNKVKILNMAGPRESEATGLGEFARRLLESSLSGE